MRNKLPVTGREDILPEGAILISHTDAKGTITFANDDFAAVSGFSREELIGQPHNLIRHPDMPTEAFRVLLAAGHDRANNLISMARSARLFYAQKVLPKAIAGGDLTQPLPPKGGDEIGACLHLAIMRNKLYELASSLRLTARSLKSAVRG